MNLLDISRRQLLYELYESKKMIYRILNLPVKSQSLIAMSISPFLSLLCDGIDNLFSEENSKLSESLGLIDEVSFTKLMSQNRASIKLLTDKKISNAIKIIDKQLLSFNNALTKDYNILQKGYVSIFGQPDLGVYYYKGVAFANTSQLSIYQDMFRKITNDDITDNRLGPIIRDFSEIQSSYIKTFTSQIEGNLLPKIDSEKCKVNIIDSNFSEKDFIFLNEAKRNIFMNSDDKNSTLYLFNLKCQLSFSLKIIPRIIERDHSLRFRIEMIVYYQSVKTIEFLIKKNKFPFNNITKEIIDNMLMDSHRIFLDNNLRSNIYHYRFSEDNAQMEMTNDFFISMVEFQTQQNFNDIFSIIENDMEKLIEVLDEITSLI
ncbi:hypothetical protein BN988_02753 [Oceanobacillus picturae]|uniref:Uncharacterized protein n=1 Tax=Oceanobacillus picturae TaxID=171693 RepID=W9AFF1_9BACI|nr:hypothetical protein [Oceanobacillus picturae]CDO04203.1 hypothetical protein BN988_02753 [Oceanobacillus picturae]